VTVPVVMTVTAHMDAPVVVNSDQAQRMAQQELAKPQYHVHSGTSQPLQLPSAAVSTPAPQPQTQHSASAGHAGVIVLVVLGAIVLVIVVIVLLRWLGRPRTEKPAKEKPAKHKTGATAAEEVLFGAARHRRAAQLAAESGDFAEAIRERFRAVIATLDERGLLPERPERTADEAARDAGALLPAHAGVLNAAARAFDDVEYGEYVGTAEGYRLISEVDDLVSGAQPGALAAVGGGR
jgi:Domain of unknown function (DUF4129)